MRVTLCSAIVDKNVLDSGQKLSAFFPSSFWREQLLRLWRDLRLDRESLHGQPRAIYGCRNVFVNLMAKLIL